MGIEDPLNLSPWSTDRTGVEPEWISTAEAARRLGMTPRTVHRFIDKGDLVAYKFGRVVRIRDTDVAQFIEDARIEPGTLGAK